MSTKESLKIQQFVIPQKAFVGDSVLIKCSFNVQSENLKDAVLSEQNFLEPINHDLYEIKNISLKETGINFYELNITIISWQTGNIFLPDFAFENFIITFEPIQISSVLEGNKNVELRKIQSPVLIPGTTYALYSSVFILILIIIVLTNLIVKRKKVAAWIKAKKRKMELQRNKKILLKAVNELKNSENLDIKDFSKNIQTSLRKYLTVRFEHQFYSLTTEQINNLLADFPKVEKEQFVQIFKQTDFFRYHEILQNNNELTLVRKNLCNEIINLINKTESDLNEEKKVTEADNV